MSKEHKKAYRNLNYFQNSPLFIYLSISTFASLVSILIGIASSAVRLKICAITAGIKKFKSVNKNFKLG